MISAITASLIFDCVVMSICIMYILTSIDFIKSKKTDITNPIHIEHSNEHFLIAVIGILGGAMSFSFSLLSFFGTYIYKVSDEVISYIDIVRELGFVLIVISGILFMIHLKKEETPSHQYYVFRPSKGD